MLAIVFAMIIIMAIAAGTAGLVVVGLEGRGRRRAPHVADKVAKAARHLNGDSPPPKRFVESKLLARLR